jgi:uncharacterized protein YhbP (UPF0306 family)
MDPIEKTIREYLSQVIHMSLATSSNNKPWVCEVHFTEDDELNLYFRSQISRRHSLEIAENPHVAGNIVRQFGVGEEPLGVYFEGTAKLLEPGSEWDKAFDFIKAKQQKDDSIIDDARNDDGAKPYKITVENWYVFGRIDGGQMQKHKLEWN